MLLLPAGTTRKTEYASLFVTGCLVIILLLLSILNIETCTQKPKVLGIHAESTVEFDEVSFWQGFVAQNPTYLDGWRELYRLTGDARYHLKATEINPNYEVISSALP